MCTTTLAAFELGKKLIADYDQRRHKEKEMNQRKADAPKPKAAPKEGVSRTVTEIDYEKHERTVAELKRQEEEEEFNRKKTEAAQWCTLDHEHGPECRRPVMGCSHDHQKEWQIYEKSTEEKLNAAERFKKEGNEAFRKHNYGLAAVHYRKALLQFDYTFAEGPEEEKRHDEIKLACLLNLAACKSHQEEWDDVLMHCRLALEINPRSVKAYYRTGLAHLARDDFELAKDALLSAHEIEPNNPEVLARLKQLKQNMADYKAKRKEVAKEMLTGADAESAHAAVAGSEATSATPSPVLASEELGPAIIALASVGGVAEPLARGDEQVSESTVAAVDAEPASIPDHDVASSDAGLRRRRADKVDEEVVAHSKDIDGDDEEAFEREQGRAMRMLLIAGVFFAVAAVGVGVVAATAPDA